MTALRSDRFGPEKAANLGTILSILALLALLGGALGGAKGERTGRRRP